MNELQKQVDETIESISGIQKADPGPFFYTRLTARLEANSQPKYTRYWVPALIIMLLLNAISFWVVSTDDQTSNPVETLSQEYFGEDVADEDLLSFNE